MLSYNQMKKIWGLSIFVGSIFFLFACSKAEDVTEDSLISINYASVPAVVEAPAHVAYSKNFFREQGLEVNLQVNPDGKTSLDQLLNDKVHFASVMATPVVYQSFNRNDFYIIGNMEHGKIHSLLVNKDSGISQPKDLKGKKIAVMKGTSGEFFMNSFLIVNGLFPDELDIKYMNAPQMVTALEKNEIDGFFCWEPFPLMAAQKLGEKALNMPSVKLVPSSWLIIAKREFVDENPKIVGKFLTALNLGVDFVHENPEEALKIYAEISSVSSEIVRDLFMNMPFKLSLKQGILLDMEDEARWLITYGYVKNPSIPNYLEFIYTDAMNHSFPNQIDIIKE